MQGNDFDVSIIGGGVVGCAVLFELTRRGYKCLLLERNDALLSEASSGNSGMLHTGFDAPPNSLELKCIQSCRARIYPLLKQFGIPFEKCGTSLVAWNEEEKSRLPVLQDRCRLAGIDDASILSTSDLLRKEPFLSPSAHGALFVPGECVVDPNLLGLSFAHNARLQGAQVRTSCEVESFQDGFLQTNMGTFSTSAAINCAGLHGDFVDELAGIKTFDILPRKGHYSVYNKTAHSLINSIIFPIPTEKSKGVALFKTVYDNIVIGPTAENVAERGRPSFSAEIHKHLTETAVRITPDLRAHQCVGYYTGVRPATQYKDYQIACFPSRHWITVGGIRSTGVSASLGIGQLVADKLQTDMDITPSRGSTQRVEVEGEEGLGGQSWRFDRNGTRVTIGGYSYAVTHPICHFGHQNQGNHDSKL